VFAVLCLIVVAVRRSAFGHRLLAFKDSPAACATLGMNARASTLGVFAISAALAGIGGGVYGMALGSAAPDVFEFFSGLSVLLVMVVEGISSIGAGVAVGFFLGGPAITNFFPSLSQLTPVLVGGAGISVGSTPNGMIPAGLRPMWMSVARRGWLLSGLVVVVIGAWALRLGHVIDNWTMTSIDVVFVVALPAFVYGMDYRRGGAPGAFGLPDRLSVSANSPTASPESMGLSQSVANSESQARGA
jgi:branched-chain amino acid transport system permease protein